MNQFKSMAVVFCLVLAVCVSTVAAQTSAFTYQGRLTDGAAAANGTYEMQFKLFDSASGATQIGSTVTNNSVSVVNGIFTVTLNFGATAFAAGADRWLEIGVRKVTDPPGFTTLAPRQQLTSSPYSIKTLSADALSSNCVACVTDAQINSIGGAKVTGTVANATNAGTATIAGNVTGIVAVTNGGTGSASKNFVDLSTDQIINGNKTFGGNATVLGTFSATLGQAATTVYGTGSLLVTSTTAFTILPGLTTTINVPANYKVLVIADGGIQTTSTAGTGFSTIDIALHIDNVLTGAGGYRRVQAINSTAITSVLANWSLSSVLTLTPGSHTISIRAAGNAGANATVGGDSSSVLQGELTVILVKN